MCIKPTTNLLSGKKPNVSSSKKKNAILIPKRLPDSSKNEEINVKAAPPAFEIMNILKHLKFLDRRQDKYDISREQNGKFDYDYFFFYSSLKEGRSRKDRESILNPPR